MGGFGVWTRRRVFQFRALHFALCLYDRVNFDSVNIFVNSVKVGFTKLFVTSQSIIILVCHNQVPTLAFIQSSEF